ncbi:MAG: methyltransferase domain-containing protein [Desulfovibrionaceae bacterium]
MDRSFEVYEGSAMSMWVQRMTRQRIDWICTQARGCVLDVGCSQGVVPFLLAQRGLHVVGIDADAEALAWAHKKIATCPAEIQNNITLHHTLFEDFSSETCFDTIIAGEYLEHLTDTQLDIHLEKMSHLMKPEAVFICTTPLGLHPHPDHHQTFFPRTLVEHLIPHFSIVHMSMEDGYIRCLCNTNLPHKKPSAQKMLILCEKGLRQIQERTFAGKQSAPQAAPRPLSNEKKADTDCIAEYLHEQKTETVNPLSTYLANQGIRPPYSYDLRLFSALNAFYEATPLVPAPRKIAATSLFAQADTRVDFLLKLLPSFAGLKCLEVGCGRGETAVRLVERGACTVTGVDITLYAEWSERWNANTKFLPLDLTKERPFALEFFDFVYSFVVLEHVAEPLTMLNTIHQLLKPGGTCYFTANLYRGPMASHRYREVFFPWPHLLFDDAVFTAYYQQQGYGFAGKPAWVNKLTHLHYLEQVKKLGFHTQHCNYVQKPLDVDFYTCFQDKLGKYPHEDLEIDFIKMQLVK